MAAQPHVVVLGAGFGGLAAVSALAGADVRTTLVDARYYQTFQPLLYQVATAGLNPGDIAYPLRGLLRRQPDLDFRCARVDSVDLAARRVRLAPGEHAVAVAGEADELDYDYLVIATGAATNWYGVRGAEAHALPVYTLDDALAVRGRMFAQLEHADAHGGGAAGELTVAVVGGGATGVETAGAIAELRSMALGRIYRSLDPARSRVVLVERAERLLGAFAPSLGDYAAGELRRRGVEVRLATAVEEVAAGRVRLRSAGAADAEELPCSLVLWAAGIGPGPLAAGLGVTLGAGGRVVVEETLALPGRPEVFAIGDVAAVPGAGGQPLPQLAQPAIQGGDHAARQILRALDGLPPQPLHYRDKGIMATIGRRSAVAELRVPLLPGRSLPLRGSPAWLAWLGLHVVTLLGRRNRAAVLLNWAWRYLAWRRGPRVIVGG